MIDVGDIEKRVEKAIAAPISVNTELGGVVLETMGEVMEFAKLMAVSGAAVPKYLRGNPGGCLAICSRALRWRMDPFAVAEQSYIAYSKGGEEHVGYQAQLIHAVVTAHAPLKGRLRSEIIGIGDARRCRVWGTFKGEEKPHEYTSETLGNKVKAIGLNDKGQLKGSPLWVSDPEVQLTYSAVRQWCRLHSSETILGLYAPDEMEPANPMDVSSAADKLTQKLKDARQAHVGERGFDVAHVAKVIEGEAMETGDESDGSSERTDNETGGGGRTVADSDRSGDDHDKARRAAGGQEHQAPRAKPADKSTAREKAPDLFARQETKPAPKTKDRRR